MGRHSAFLLLNYISNTVTHELRLYRGRDQRETIHAPPDQMCHKRRIFHFVLLGSCCIVLKLNRISLVGGDLVSYLDCFGGILLIFLVV